MQRSYYVPLSEIRREFEVQKSHFIATLAPALTISEARTFITRIKSEFADAAHNVQAYVIGGGSSVTEYFSDDGEPSGTAGRPALTVIRGSGLGDAVMVITRYFGGTLLGTGGLVKAYTESAQLVVNSVGRGQRVSVNVTMVAIPYNFLERVRLIIKRRQGEVLGEEFAGDITITMQLPVVMLDEFQRDLAELSAGKIRAEVIETKEKIFPV
jgi:uncharacterized YigZ family protein